MKCPHCGADSSVLATRAYKEVMLKRKRRCFNNHEFHTYEVFAGNLDRRTLADTRRGVQVKQLAWSRRRCVLSNPHLPASVLADRLKITEARVRQMRTPRGR